MTIEYLPIYYRVQDNTPKDYSFLNHICNLPLSQQEVDFSYDDRTWKDTATRIAMFLLKVLIPVWGVYSLAKYITQRLIMIVLYPAQSRIVNFFLQKTDPSSYSVEALNRQRTNLSHFCTQHGYIVRHVVLEKNGVRYSGLLLGHTQTITNGKWVVQALGNLDFIEENAGNIAWRNEVSYNFNTLLINGPAVGLSQGEANPDTMGDAQEIGITFLETAFQAKKIVLSGFSLGGAAMGQAILKHQFKKDVQYLVIRQMSFDRASNVGCKFIEEKIFQKNFQAHCPRLIKKMIKKIIKWSDTELDSVEASKKLQQLRIPEIIIQCGKDNGSETTPKLENFRDDGVIPPKASLGYRLVKENITENKKFYCVNEPHGHLLSILNAYHTDMSKFSYSKNLSSL